jgi:8-oxo-dGTP diphosphatase
VQKPPPYTVIIGTLIYVWDRATDTVLMVTRPNGRMNGLGGKLEPDESIATCAMRELDEESSIAPVEWCWRGSVHWPGFGPQGEGWIGHVFVVTSWTGEPLTENDEGSLSWVPRRDLLTPGRLDLWGGDHHFLPLVFDDDPRIFDGIIPYANGHPQHHLASFVRM